MNQALYCLCNGNKQTSSQLGFACWRRNELPGALQEKNLNNKNMESNWSFQHESKCLQWLRSLKWLSLLLFWHISSLFSVDWRFFWVLFCWICSKFLWVWEQWVRPGVLQCWSFFLLWKFITLLQATYSLALPFCLIHVADWQWTENHIWFK